MCVPSLRVVAEPNVLVEIDNFLDALWAANPQVPPTTRFRLGIAVSEIAANVVVHATKGMDRPVDLRMWAVVRADDIVVTIADDGIPVSDGLLTREMPHELEERGRGIPLAYATLSALTYRRTNQLNVWTLVSERFPTTVSAGKRD